MVQSMVTRLAARLEEEPDDLEGWLHLANAYTVLGELDAARGAVSRAEPLLHDAAPERQAYEICPARCRRKGWRISFRPQPRVPKPGSTPP